MSEQYAAVSWVPYDLVLQYGLTEDQAASVLEQLAKGLESRMVEAGWDYIDVWLPEYGYGRCDTCNKIYDTSSRDGRCGDCGDCGEHCECEE